MKKQRNTAIFVRILHTVLVALVLCFVGNSGFALSANESVMCDVGTLKSDTSAQFRAVWCPECSQNAVKTTTCELNVNNGSCEYTGVCRDGYENLTNLNTENLSCSPTNYNITYYLYDGVNNPSNPSSYTVEDTVVFGNPTKSGHTFNGWFTSATAAQNNDPVGVITQILPGTTTGDKALYAKWTANSYVVKYDCDNSNGDISFASMIYGNAGGQVPRIATSCSNKGFSPSGWTCTRSDNNQDVSNIFVEQSFISTWNIDSDVNCVAQWNAITYNIEYKENVDNVVSTISGLSPNGYVLADLPLTVNTVPDEKIGYDFYGWCSTSLKENCSENFVIYETNPQPQTTTLWADWRLTDYTITYELDGGTNDTNNPSTYTIKDDVAFLPATKPGYDFVGWSLVNNKDVLNTGWTAGEMHENVVAYAIWEPITYNISYENMSGTRWGSETDIPPYEYTIESNDIQISNPLRDGYEFLGWCKNMNSCTTPTTDYVIESGSYGDISLYAQWEPIIYNITYNNMDNAQWHYYDAHPTTYTVEDDSIYIGNPEIFGYEFLGWCKNTASCAEPKTNYIIETGTFGDINLYARWSANTYNITYELDGGEFVNITPKSTYDVTETFTLSTPTKTGYNFVGWCNGYADCFSPEKPLTIESGTTEGDLTFYARWEPAVYTVTYKCERNATPVHTDNVYYDSYYEFVGKTNSSSGYNYCTKTGYDFEKWKCSYVNNNTTVSLEPNTIENWNIASDVNCEPVWQERSFTVLFRPNSAYVSNPNAMANITCLYETGCVLPENLYVRSGYEFGGWIAEDTDDETLYKTGDTIKHKTENTVLYAQWDNAKIWCDSGTYLPHGQQECSECPIGYYCPESRYWEFDSTNDQGVSSCEALMLNYYATSNAGASSENDCYVPCAAKDGYVLNSEHAVLHYNSTDRCVYEATINYKGNNSCNAQPQTYQYSDNGMVNLCVPNTIIGRTFIGWTDNKGRTYNVANNPNLQNISISALSPENGFVTMTPNWDIETHTLTYDCNINNKTIIVDDLEYDYEETLIDYTVCDNPGYTFNGWLCNNTLYDSGDVFNMPNRDAVCVAQITPNTYNIEFNGNGADSGDMDIWTGLRYDLTYTLKPNEYSRNGYNFTGWCDDWNENTQTCRGKTYADKQSFSGLATSGTITLYAIWTPVRYTITYVRENGLFIATSNPSYYYVTTPTFTLSAPSLQGYTFTGWCDTNNDCSVTKTVEQGTTGNLRFVAQMEETQYRINYNYVDENNRIIPLTGVEPSTYTISTPAVFPRAQDVTIPGYTLVGWYIDSGLRFATYQTSSNSVGDISVYGKVLKLSCPVDMYTQNGVCVPCGAHSHSNGGYATECDCENGYTKRDDKCVAQKYTIDYVFNGGVLPVGVTNPTTYSVESVNVTLNNPTKDLSTFVGWYTTPGFSGNRITNIPGNLTGDITLYARWQQISCARNYYVENNACVPCGPNSSSNGGTATECDCNNGYEKISGICVEKPKSTITYNCGNSTVINRTEYQGVNISFVTNAECRITTGVLSGWECEGISYKLTDTFVVPNHNITCNAEVLDPSEIYTITYKAFDKNDEEINLGNITPNTYTEYTPAIFPTELNVNGYTFGGWYVDKNLRFRTYQTTKTTSGNITVYAKLTPAVIHCDAGTYLPSGAMTCEVCEEGKYCIGGDFPYSPDEPQGLSQCEEPYPYSKPGTKNASRCYQNCENRDGYDVVSGVKYKNGLSSCQYELKTYYITYVLNGGTFNGTVVNPQPYNTSMPNITALPVPVRPDKAFDKWFDETGSEITVINTKLATDRRLYAQWKAKPCEENQYMVGETCMTCPDGLYSDGGYATECSCKPGYQKVTTTMSQIYPVDRVRVESYSASGYDWHIDVVPRTWMYNYADGLGQCRNKSASTGAAWNDNYDPNIAGTYCWCKMESPVETKWIYSGYQNGSKCTELCAETCGARAKTNPAVTKALFTSAYNDGGADIETTTCEIITYNITYIGLEGANHTNPSTYTVEDAGLEITAPENRTGYTFTGWTLDDVAFTKITDGLIGDITLKANWEPTSIHCEPGYYIPAGSTTCNAPCPENAYCPANEEYPYDPDNNQGIEYCPSEYPNSVQGTYDKNKCYKPCDTDEDALSSGGKLYYDGTDLCEYTYPITYILNGGVLNTSLPTTYEYNSGNIDLVAPTKQYNSFVGWYDNVDMIGEKIEYIDTTHRGPITLYAKWDFVCESGKWLRIGDNRLCLYTEKQTSPSMVIDLDDGPYYIMLSQDSVLPIHKGANQKMHVEYNGTTYNAHDASVE